MKTMVKVNYLWGFILLLLLLCCNPYPRIYKFLKAENLSVQNQDSLYIGFIRLGVPKTFAQPYSLVFLLSDKINISINDTIILHFNGEDFCYFYSDGIIYYDYSANAGKKLMDFFNSKDRQGIIEKYKRFFNHASFELIKDGKIYPLPITKKTEIFLIIYKEDRNDNVMQPSSPI